MLPSSRDGKGLLTVIKASNMNFFWVIGQETRQGIGKIIGFPPNQSEYSLIVAL